MKRQPRDYRGDDITVTFDIARCIHASECVRGLPQVFDTKKKPWIQPENAPAGEVAEVIHRCPSGALTYRRHDGGPDEGLPPEEESGVAVVEDGPLYLRGDLVIEDAEGNVLERHTRLALCRCGQSQNKPLCDNSHIAVGFRAR